jgi:hypothetical protein
VPNVVERESLAGAWSRSQEEDQGDVQVFRRPGYAFPRSRGRMSYELKLDGTLGGSRPGPDDRTVATSGRWDLQGNKLTISPEGGSPVQYQIQSIDGDRMVVKPVTNQQ